MHTNTSPTSPTEVFREWQRCLAANDQKGASRVVDIDGYTEICVGLTGWTTGYEVAAANFYRNMVAPWSDMSFSVEDLTESADGVTVRSHIVATHTGEFLGVPATGRRIEWDHVAIVKIKDGRVVGQWAQPDLWGIDTQLTRPQTDADETQPTDLTGNEHFAARFQSKPRARKPGPGRQSLAERRRHARD